MNRCPNQQVRCNSKEFAVLQSFDGSDNVDGLAHNHMICKDCGCQFNLWLNVTIEKLKEVFGPSWELYI